MPTRVYLPSANAAAVSPAFDAAWEKTSAADRIRAVVAKENTALATRQISPSATGDTLVRQYVSDPLNSGSVSGTVKGVIQAGEYTAYGTFKTQMSIRIVNRAGTSVTGTLLAAAAAGRGSDFVPTLTNRYLAPAATALSSVVAAQGDRIVIEVGIYTVVSGWWMVENMKFGDPTASSDLSENETQTTAGDPWIEFSTALSFESGGGPPAPIYSAPVGGPMTTPRTEIPWRVNLCDGMGVTLADITRIFSEDDMAFIFKRAAGFSFSVPSDHTKIKTLHTDGYPFLQAGQRTVKAYRYEGASYVLRYAGDVLVTDDIGEGDHAHTRVVTFDPLKYLERRLAKDAANSPFDVVFAGDEAAQIARILIERANVQSRTGVAIGTVEATTPRTVTFDTKFIASALIELADADPGFDFYFGPVERTDGVLVSANFYAVFGADRPDVIFAWAKEPRSAGGASRVQDGSLLANSLYGRGNGGIVTAERSDSTSITRFRRYEDVVSYLDIDDATYLTAQVDAELAVRKDLKERVTLTPAPGRAPEPFSHFFLGDTVRSRASTDLRGGFTRTDRIYGFTLSIANGEKLTSVTVVPS